MIPLKRRIDPDPVPEPKKSKPAIEHDRTYDPESGIRAVNIFRDFASAFRAIGHSLYSDDHCGRLLAYCALSGSEDVVTNTALSAAILVAQDTFNIKGGEVPDLTRLVYWRKAMQDLRDKGTRSEWWGEFAGRYDIEPRRWPVLDEAFKANFVYFQGPMTAQKIGRLREDDDTDDKAGCLPVTLKRMARLRGDDDDDSPSGPRLRE